jgi:hypothetical protein
MRRNALPFIASYAACFNDSKKGIAMFLSDKGKAEIRAKLAEMEKTTVATEKQGNVPIEKLAREDAEISSSLLKSNDALMPVLRTALVINWKEKAMSSRYNHFRKSFPEITTLTQLKEAMDQEDPLAFCDAYLNIKASSENNPKYRLLKTLVDGFLEYCSTLGISTEIGALRHWAENVDIKNLNSDPIGRLHGVGIGVVENIRRNLGMHVIKPDRHVIGVMEKWLQLKLPPTEYGNLADSISVDRRYFDFVLFKFGQAKGISA